MILQRINKNNWFQKMLQSPFDMRFINSIIDAINTTHDMATAATLPYTVYVAKVQQKAEAAPTDTVLQNTLGGTVTWVRSDQGIYVGTCTVPFTKDSEIWCSFTPSSYPTVVKGKLIIDGKIELRSYDMDGVLKDDLLIGSLEIRQY